MIRPTLEEDALLAELDALAAKASPDHDVVVSWYPQKDGFAQPQFENSRGLIAQEDGDYEFYAALRTAWPRIRKALWLEAWMERNNQNTLKAIRDFYSDKP